MNELISIIIPIYNVEKYLHCCINSVIRQTYKNLEIILIDDGSPDNCGKICDEYAKKDNRIKVIHKENGGLSSARNAGLDIAKGEYISFVDSDDYVAENFIEKLYKLCKENDADIAECDFYRIKANEKSMLYVSTTAVMNKELNCDDKLLVGNVTTWRIMFNRQFIMLNNITQVNLPAEDIVSYPFIIS